MQVEQPLQLGEILFLTFFLGMIAYFVILNVSILIMHFLMPKEVLTKYFRPPYFREFECEFFTGIPYAPIRTVMFLRVIAFPNAGQKRGMTDVYKMVPKNFRMWAKILIIFLVTGFILILVYLFGVGVYLVLE